MLILIISQNLRIFISIWQYISTGGFKRFQSKAIEKLNNIGIKDIELSGGKYDPNLLKQIKKYNKLNLKAHNYFPPQKNHSF